MAKLLIQLHSVAFRCIPIVYAGLGYEVPVCTGTTGANDVCEQCSNQRGYGVSGSCRWFGGWAYVRGGVTFGRFANRPYIHTRAGCEVPVCAGTMSTDNVAISGVMA